MSVSKQVKEIEKDLNDANATIEGNQNKLKSLQDERAEFAKEAQERIKDLQQRDKGVEAEMQELVKVTNDVIQVKLKLEGKLELLKEMLEKEV